MSLILLVRCDFPGCQNIENVPGFQEDDWGGGQPACSDNLRDDSPRRAHMVIDTGWIYLPDGWEFATGDDDPHPIRCPFHRDRSPEAPGPEAMGLV